MTIAQLLPEKDSSEKPSEEDRALVFVLNNQFLDQFAVLCESLARTRSFLRIPVVIITDEPEVGEAPLVKAIADQIIQVSDEDTSYIGKVDTSRVPERFKYKHLPKFTFIKWMIFKLKQYREIVYLDCDMICTKKLDDDPFFSEPMGEVDLFACPVFPGKIYDLYLEDEAAYTELLQTFIQEQPTIKSNRMNSGTMRIGTGLLDGRFFEDLLQFASEYSYTNEQSYLTSFFRKSKDYQISLWTPWCNMHASNLGRLEIGLQLQWMESSAILHFIGKNKPSLTSGPSNSMPHFIWKQFAKAAIDRAKQFE